MRKIKILTRENIPCWYELSFRKTKPAIVLRTHKDFVEINKKTPTDNWMVNSFKEQFGFSSFIGDLERNFGFDDAFNRRGEKGEFVEFVIQVPLIKKDAGVCSYCDGSGEGDFIDGKCLRCDGKGRDYDFDWKLAYKISASFTMFFNLSHLSKEETSSSLPQLMTVQTITLQESHGGSLDGMFSIPLCNWMGSLDEKEKSSVSNEVLRAMQATHKVMFGGLRPFEKHSFQVYITDRNAFVADCPGDACGIHPSSTYEFKEEGTGYEFSCHNVDNPMQQLNLLTALAVLHDKAKRGTKT